MSDYSELYNLVWNNDDDVVIYQTKHHPYTDENGVPYGMEIEVAHNRTQNAWVKITPASGSLLDPLTEEEATALMADGVKTKYKSRPDV